MPWFPADESEAVSARTVFIEWLRATGRMPDADPATLQAWRHTHPAAFREAFAAFAGIDAAEGLLDAAAPFRPRP